MSTSGRNWTSRLISPVPSQVGQRNAPVLYEKSPALYPRSFASARARVVREVARLVSAFLRVRRAGVDLAEFVMDVRVCRNSRTDVDADGRRVDELHLRDAGRGERANMRGEYASSDLRGEPRNKAFKDQRRLSAPGNARHDRKLALGERHLQRLHGMDRRGGK